MGSVNCSAKGFCQRAAPGKLQSGYHSGGIHGTVNKAVYTYNAACKAIAGEYHGSGVFRIPCEDYTVVLAVYGDKIRSRPVMDARQNEDGISGKGLVHGVLNAFSRGNWENGSCDYQKNQSHLITTVLPTASPVSHLALKKRDPKGNSEDDTVKTASPLPFTGISVLPTVLPVMS